MLWSLWGVSRLGQAKLLNYNQIVGHVADQNYIDLVIIDPYVTKILLQINSPWCYCTFSFHLKISFPVTELCLQSTPSSVPAQSKNFDFSIDANPPKDLIIFSLCLFNRITLFFDFPGGGANLSFGNNFSENRMNTKEIGPERGRPRCPMGPPMPSLEICIFINLIFISWKAKSEMDPII